MASTAALTDQRGSVLIIAVLAMVILGVLGMAFVVLADLEVRIGINHKEAVQALALAEAGLAHGRDRARTLAAAGGFPATFSDPLLVGNGLNASLLLGDQAYAGGGRYSARIDNDCAGIVPAGLADPGCAVGQDTNKRAVLTAWATGPGDRGRARVRAWVTIDDPWKHVCASDDDPCYTQHGNPAVTPSSPEDPHGPATFTQLPNPVVGDHPRRAACAPSLGLGGQVMPVYFDFAVKRTSPLGPPDFPNPPAGTNRGGWDPVANPNGCGMVVDGDWSPDGTPANPLHVNQTALAGGGPVVVYVTGRADIRSQTHIQGTVVVHGDGAPNTKDIKLAPDVCFNRLSVGPNCGAPNTGAGNWTKASAEGYPLGILLYNPAQPPPQPAQNVKADVSDPNVSVSGIVYSGGTVEFNPINLDGGVVAYNVTFQATSSSMTYNATYGDNAPPPGFTDPAGAVTVSVIRRTWKHCTTYVSDANPAVAPTACD